MSNEIKKTSKLKGLIASLTLPILGVGAALAPNKAEAARSGYGASVDYSVSNIVQFFQGSSERESGIDQAILSYQIKDAQNNRNVNNARSQLSSRQAQLENAYTKAKTNAMNKYRYAQQRGDTNGMVQAYTSLVSAGSTYIKGHINAYDGWGRALTNAQKNAAGAALRADIATVNAIHYGNRMQSNSLDRVRAGVGIGGNISGGSWGAKAIGSAGNVLSATRSLDEYGKAREIGNNAQNNAQLLLVTGSNIYNDIGVAASEKIAIVQNDLAPMEDYIRTALTGTNNHNLQTKFENAVLDAGYEQEQINLAGKIQRGLDNASIAAAQHQQRGESAQNNANRKASQNLQHATKGIRFGAGLRKIIGR